MGGRKLVVNETVKHLRGHHGMALKSDTIFGTLYHIAFIYSLGNKHSQ